ncbi:pleckstrin homology domain-containing family F member 2-like isoform X2 [Dermacentor albipictus]|uniref:pleckstrin homology domain-containing family F member 2-like isoform X2 n=1 Tax=Dermacentor albipictus TaxID=60249 RepID=UPI0031FD1E58
MVDSLVNTRANAKRIANIENCFGSSGQPLASHGRVLVGEGVLTKMCRKKQKPRQFFLFNDILVYGNILINKKKYNKQHIIPLEEVKLENLGDDGTGLKNGWLIRTPTKSFAVYAATATEKTEWMAHINKCVEDTIRKTGKYPTKEHAAVWVPDAEAGYCMHCRKTQFTMLNRRHHCRKCGTVVCGPCSNRKFLLPAQSTKPLRVCLTCYDALSRASILELTTGGMARVQQKMDKPVTGADSSGEDDSDYDDDDNRRADGSADNGLSKDIDGLTFDEKPTFYGDMMEAKSPELEVAEEAKAVPVSTHPEESSSLQDVSPTYENVKGDAPAVDPMAGGEPHPDGH